MRPALDDDKRAIVESHLGLIDRCIRSIGVAKGERDDCYQAGALGLVEAVRRWGGDRGRSFRDYAFICIRNAIQAHRIGDRTISIRPDQWRHSGLKPGDLATYRAGDIASVDPESFACVDDDTEWPAVDIDAAVETLPPAQKRYAVECLIGGRPMKTVATEHGIDESAVRRARDAALRNLRAILGPTLYVPLPVD